MSTQISPTAASCGKGLTHYLLSFQVYSPVVNDLDLTAIANDKAWRYLDTLSPALVSCGFGSLGTGGSLGYEDKAATVQGSVSIHTISAHAPSRLVFELDDNYSCLTTSVAISDDVPPDAAPSIVFEIYIDGERKVEARGVKPGDIPRSLSVSLEGKRCLELAVTTSNFRNAHTVWIDPRLQIAPRSTGGTFHDCLGRIEIHDIPPIPERDKCVATVASEGTERSLVHLLDSLLIHGDCPDAQIVVFVVGDAPDVVRIVHRYGGLVIQCRRIGPLRVSAKSVLYSIGPIVPARRLICLDTDMLVAASLQPIFDAISACAKQVILVCREANGPTFRSLGHAMETIYDGRLEDLERIQGRRGNEEHHSLVVNDGMFAGCREALISLDRCIRSFPNAAAWANDSTAMPYRNQFVFNLALARLGCVVELSSKFNLQLQYPTARLSSSESHKKVDSRGNAVHILQLATWARDKYPVRYSTVGPELPVAPFQPRLRDAVTPNEISCQYLSPIPRRFVQASTNRNGSCVFPCGLHGECTQAVPVDGLFCCGKCEDYQPFTRPLTWAVGVTTAPRPEFTLGRTLESLIAAGWDKATVFAEPDCDVPTGWDLVRRHRPYGAWINWLDAVRSLLSQNTDVIMLVQDDVVFSSKVRAFLESVRWPEDAGVLSVYTPEHYINNSGWAKVKRGYQLVGALAYILPRDAAINLVEHPTILAHKLNRKIDSIVGLWARHAKLGVYYANPSLAQHIGDASSIYPKARNDGMRHSSNFAGEHFVATELLKTSEPSPLVSAPPARRRRRKRRFHEFISLERLASDVRSLATLLPNDLAGIVGIPRSGMIPAAMLATLLHLPLYELGSMAKLRRLDEGRRLDASRASSVPGRLLVVDDSISSGQTLQLARQSMREHQQTALFASIYVTRHDEPVDYYGRIAPIPHLFEWNLLNTDNARQYAVDFDGVLCEDFEAVDQDDDEYRFFLAEARPLYLPRRACIPLIVTTRLEKYRELTEIWLQKWGIRWTKLIMGPWTTVHERRHHYDAGKFKGMAYAASSCRLFVESHEKQAEAIFKASGKPVLCPKAGRIFQ